MTIHKFILRNMAVIIASLAVCTGFVSCKDDDNGNDNGNENSSGYFNTKASNFTFNKMSNGIATTESVMWDNYGKLFRSDMNNLSSIVDETTGKGYNLMHSNKTYIELSAEMVAVLLENRAIHKFYDSPDAQGYKKLPNRTIAGKDCMVYSYSYGGLDYTFGGWNKLMFFLEILGTMEGTENTIDLTLIATSYSDFVPNNSFTIPEDYVLRE